MKRLVAVLGLGLAAFLIAVPLMADWDPGDGHKMFQGAQMPDEEGFNVNMSGGITLADDWQCNESGAITEAHFWGSWRGGTTGTANGFTLAVYSNIPADGTVDYPAECPYATTDEPMQIIDGLPPGTTIDMDAQIRDYYNIVRTPGGNLGGEIVTFDATLDLDCAGTGDLTGFSRHLAVPVSLEVHIGSKVPGDPVQMFPLELVSMQGELFGDPDFCTFRVIAGTDFGLPSPGQSTLTDLDDGTFHIDSFFDITYEIEFEGCPGSVLEGLAGTTTATSRFTQYDVSGGFGNYVDCIVPNDGSPGSFSKPGDLLWGPVYIDDFVERHITPSPTLWEGWYDPTIGEELFDDHDNYYQFNITSIPDPFVQTEGETYWMAITADIDNLGDSDIKLGWKSTDDHWNADAVFGVSDCVAPDDGTGTVAFPVDCEFYPVPADATMDITSGLMPYSWIECTPVLQDFVCPNQPDQQCTESITPGYCETPGGDLGGTATCFEATLDLTLSGYGDLAGFNRHLSVPVFLEVHHGPRNPGDQSQFFESHVVRMYGELFGDPDFCSFEVGAGSDMGLASSGQTRLTDLGDGTFAVESFFDIQYMIDFEGCPGSILEGSMGSSGGTIRFNQGEKVWTDMYEPVEPAETLVNGFMIMMDPGGVVVDGFGEDAFGDGWYYYANENWWNIWFYDHPLDYERAKSMTLEGLMVQPFGPGPAEIEIAFNWSTDAWSIDGNPPPDPRVPPLPPLTPQEEASYVGRQTVWQMQVLGPEAIPPLEWLIPDYNPEWVSVDIRGFNVILEGTITHTCFPTGDPRSLDLSFVLDGEPAGSCCYPDGSCVEQTFADCSAAGGSYGGDFTTCEGDVSPANGVDDACETGPFGACCFSDGTCAEHTQANCAIFGGTYVGDGTSCLGDGNMNSIDDACEATGACCFPDGSCAIMTEWICGTSGGDYGGDDVACMGDGNGNGYDDACEPTGACCHPDGTCTVENQTYCEDFIGGDYLGDAALCLGDSDHNGTDDACESPTGLKWRALPDLTENGMDVSVWNDNVIADDFLCTDSGAITQFRIWGSWLGDEMPYPGYDPTDMLVTLSLLPDVPSTSTVDYPAECPYATTDNPMMIIDGLPPGTTIEMPAILMDYYNIVRAPGGGLGGEIITFDATLDLTVTGTGSLTGFSRHLAVPVSLEVHTGPKNIGDPVQTFPLDLFRLQGELFGDPDFCTFRVLAGTDYGLPCPGQSTLTQLPDGTFQVDSFFDVTYQIEFEGCPGSVLDGYTGVTTAASRFTQFDISGGPGSWTDCVVTDDGEFSHPTGSGIIWSHTYAPGTFTAELYADGLTEGFYDPIPDPGVYTFPGDTECWEYTFPVEPGTLEQLGTEIAPIVYWLVINAPNTEPVNFGWKTSAQHWNDGAAYPLSLSTWHEIRYPVGHPLFPYPVDLAFEVYGTTTCCVGRVGDANGLGGDEPTIGDISVMIDAKFITGTCVGILDCFTEADVNQSGGLGADCDDVTIGDISTLIDYLFIGGPGVIILPDCL